MLNIAGRKCMLCADFLHVPLIDLLLSETEISIESKNVDGETALHYAALRGSMEAVEALLEFRRQRELRILR